MIFSVALLIYPCPDLTRACTLGNLGTRLLIKDSYETTCDKKIRGTQRTVLVANLSEDLTSLKRSLIIRKNLDFSLVA